MSMGDEPPRSLTKAIYYPGTKNSSQSTAQSKEPPAEAPTRLDNQFISLHLI